MFSGAHPSRSGGCVFTPRCLLLALRRGIRSRPSYTRGRWGFHPAYVLEHEVLPLIAMVELCFGSWRVCNLREASFDSVGAYALRVALHLFHERLAEDGRLSPEQFTSLVELALPATVSAAPTLLQLDGVALTPCVGPRSHLVQAKLSQEVGSAPRLLVRTLRHWLRLELL